MLCEARSFPTCFWVFTLFPLLPLTISQRRLLHIREHETVTAKIWGGRERFCCHPVLHQSSPPPLLVLGDVPALEPFAKLSLLSKLEDLKQMNKQTPNQNHNQQKSQTNKKHDEDGS